MHNMCRSMQDSQDEALDSSSNVKYTKNTYVQRYTHLLGNVPYTLMHGERVISRAKHAVRTACASRSTRLDCDPVPRARVHLVYC